MAYFKCTKVSGGLKLIVTCDANFAGSVITCTDGTHTYQKTCPSSSPYEVEYEGLVAGTYTISGVAQGVTHSTTVVMSDVTESLYSTPDGKTVVPTDDIQTLLHCANIWDKAYTTLADLLADSTSLLAVTSSNNAVDYLVRSTGFSGAEQVPTMTSNTTPKGECIGYRVDGFSFPLYHAFDGNTSSFFNTNDQSPSDDEYVGYDFEHPVFVKSVSILPRFLTPNSFVKSFKVKGSNDKTTWDELASGTHTNANTTETFNVNATQAYRYIGIFRDGASYADSSMQIVEAQIYTEDGFCNNSTAMTDIGANNYCANTLLADSTWLNAICNSTYFESVLNVKVPTMTSNTTPSGECSASSTRSGYEPYKAFDGDNSSGWEANNSTTTASVRYHFTKSVKVKKYSVYPIGVPSGRIVTSRLIGSNDGSTWTDIETADHALTNGQYNNFVISNNPDYAYYGIKATESNSSSVHVNEIQFYGREDV